MGIFDALFGQKPTSNTLTVSTILPVEAKNEILRGKLPHLQNDRIFLKKGEVCHYIDKTLMMKPKVKRNYGKVGIGTTIWGLRISGGFIEPIEQNYHEQIKGIIYITNKRTIFQAESNGFDKAHTSLTAVVPYSNAVDMQYGSTHYCLIVPDGHLVNEVYNIIHKPR